MPPIFRFAPSPTGHLHLGHALSALCVWREAEKVGGTVLLRIEDIDPQRSRPEHVAAICEDLDWLGLRWDGEIRRQSEHLDDHRAALDRLAAAGLVYPCRLTRADIAAALARIERETGAPWPRDPDGTPRLPIPGAEPSPDETRKAIRLDMAKALVALGGETLTWRESGCGPAGETGPVVADPSRWGDVILARKETPTSYHLAVVVDDALQGVTHVVRGQDMFYATAVHRLLQRLIGLPEPSYRHHRLVSDADGAKLAKSRGSKSLRELRADGWSKDDVIAAVDALLRVDVLKSSA
ncbi:tRNA glutamyl-Q(34) synthetase GluQRS [Chenggangzhangella methanolivorans]|uniref:tRNA glutamyl-Q(34) synthetase GluQRS n=1 Tax=Chenggangzhangella methanolivorans TaxID=1437009 RepID=A0A9E6RES7_9HYPH|nr:tRNA glutamyl-Q(34) synthetase GluQRS [Chenggangzhangella methanolivorans]QZO02184.1 tRNA glutamyl-Q(34) synthetase GluQRS [Chenggangzhangella methanolivorans]